MTSVAIFLILNLVAAGAFFLGRASGRGGVRPAILGTILVAVLAGLKGLFFLHPACEARWLPYPAYGYVQNFYLVPALLLALGLVLPRLPRRWNPRGMMLLAAAFFVFGMHVSGGLLRPVQGAKNVPDRRHHVVQSTPQTCAPAACASALSYLGVATSERAMVELCLTTHAGTSDFCIYRGLCLALRDTGYRARVAEATADDLVRPGTLAVISVRSHTHAICVLGTGAGVIVQDPLEGGPEVWSAERLRGHFAGMAVFVERRVE